MPDRTQFLLHIGCLKTGSTSIQKFLSGNVKTLKEHGYHVLKSAGHPNAIQLMAYSQNPRVDAESGVFGSVFHRQYNIKSEDQLNEFRSSLFSSISKELSKAQSRTHTVIASNENLIHLREPEIKTLRDLVESLRLSVKIVVYLRRQDEFSVSKYSSELKSGSTRTLSETLLNHRQIHYLMYDRVLGNWSAVFGKENIVPRIFTKDHLINGDVVRDFVSSAGIQIDDNLTSVDYQNTSMSKRVQDFFRLYNASYPFEFNAFNRRTLSSLYKALSAAFPGGPTLPTREEAREHLAYFEESNRRLAQEWFPEAGRAFSQDVSRYPDSVQPGEEPLDRVEMARALLTQWQDDVEEVKRKHRKARPSKGKRTRSRQW